MDLAAIVERMRFERAAGMVIGPEPGSAAAAQRGPVFILGCPRSGTTALRQALMACGSFGSFSEGNAWGQLLLGFRRLLRMQKHQPAVVFEGERTLSHGRLQVLLAEFGRTLDAHHRRFVAGPRWLDKSIDLRSLRAAPLLAQALPDARFVFLVRSGIDASESAFKKFPATAGRPGSVFGTWAAALRAWRKGIALALGPRGLCIRQEEMVARPAEVVSRLAEFLGEPSLGEESVKTLQRERVNSSYAERRPGDYGQPVDWPPELRRRFIELCGAEMRWWGYPMERVGIVSEPRSEIETLREQVADLTRQLEHERQARADAQDLVVKAGERHAELWKYAQELEKGNRWLQSRADSRKPRT